MADWQVGTISITIWPAGLGLSHSHVLPDLLAKLDCWRSIIYEERSSRAIILGCMNLVRSLPTLAVYKDGD